MSFGRDGAHKRRTSPTPAAPRVIPVTSNLDWRQDRKQRLGIASNIQSLGPLVSMRRADSSAVPSTSASPAPHHSDNNTDAINTEAQKRGLELRKSKPRLQDAGQVDFTDSTAAAVAQSPAPEEEEAGTDQEALKALLSGDVAGGSNTAEPLIIHQDESELLQHDIDSRPEAPTLDDYAATPIDQFGMALLRGMGWKEGMGAGKGGKGPQQAPEPKKRAALLGLGAKERPIAFSNSPSLSSRSQHRPKDKRDYKYVPLAKNESAGLSNARSDTSESRTREDMHSERRSRDKDAPRDGSKRHTEVRHVDPRDSSRYEHSRSSRSHRSRSPTSRRGDDRDRYRDRHRDHRREDRDSERRSHESSRSNRDHGSDRDRDDRRRDHRR